MLQSIRPSRPGATGGLKALALAALSVLALALPAFAAETIDSFDSMTVLATDGTVDVTEAISVTSEGDRRTRLRVVESGFAALSGSEELRAGAHRDNTGGWAGVFDALKKRAEEQAV